MINRYKIAINAAVIAISILSVRSVTAQWVQTNGPSGGWIKAMCVADSNIFAGTWGKGVFLSTDNGTTWKAVDSGYTDSFITSFAASGSRIFAGTHYGGVYFSNDNGKHWIAAGLTNLEVQTLAVKESTILAGTNCGVYLSADNGASWTAADLTKQAVHSLAVSGSNVFAGTDFGVFLSTNNGTSWTATDLTKLAVYSLAVIGRSIFAGTYGDGVFLSINNGASWTAVNSGLSSPSFLSVKSFAASGGNVFTGTDAGVFLSINNGTSWSAVNSGLTNLTIHSLAVSGNDIFAATGNSSVWCRPLSDFSGTIDNQTRSLAGNNDFLILFPRSAGSKASITFTLTRKERVSMAICNLSGISVMFITDNQFESGSHTISWDTKSMVPGYYLIKMLTGTRSRVKGFAMIR